jgi:hypothetical protein
MYKNKINKKTGKIIDNEYVINSQEDLNTLIIDLLSKHSKEYIKENITLWIVGCGLSKSDFKRGKNFPTINIMCPPYEPCALFKSYIIVNNAVSFYTLDLVKSYVDFHIITFGRSFVEYLTTPCAYNQIYYQPNTFDIAIIVNSYYHSSFQHTIDNGIYLNFIVCDEYHFRIDGNIKHLDSKKIYMNENTYEIIED